MVWTLGAVQKVDGCRQTLEHGTRRFREVVIEENYFVC
jgi:hypothetical protein